MRHDDRRHRMDGFHMVLSTGTNYDLEEDVRGGYGVPSTITHMADLPQAKLLLLGGCHALFDHSL